MAKRGNRRGKSKPAGSAEKNLHRSLYEVDKLLESEKYVEARSALQDLDRQFPDHEDVLRGLANVYLLEPDSPDILNNLASAYTLQRPLTVGAFN